MVSNLFVLFWIVLAPIPHTKDVRASTDQLGATLLILPQFRKEFSTHRTPANPRKVHLCQRPEHPPRDLRTRRVNEHCQSLECPRVVLVHLLHHVDERDVWAVCNASDPLFGG